MEKSVTISKKLPALKSMQYKTLRDLGLGYIRDLSGKIWTDYNTHDPGITILEALSYAITDLGYRINYPIPDILAQDKNDPEYKDIRNFYTAAQILPNCPVTINDFRKLMMDVEVVDAGTGSEDTSFAGIKNAWIEQSPDAEQKIYVNRSESRLSFDEVPGVSTPETYYAKALFDVLLEFDETDEFGDLNANTIQGELDITEHLSDTNLEGLTFSIKVQFPGWDDETVSWTDPISVQKNIIGINIKIEELPDNYQMEALVSNLNEVILTGTKDIGGTTTSIDGLDILMATVHDFLYHPSTGLLQNYLKKVKKIHEVVDEVREKLHANRNLCDDFYRFNALKIEEIIVCADVELQAVADIDEVEAKFFKAISDFLSPQVNFYTLQEMLDKCKGAPQYKIYEIRKTKRTFTIKQKPEEDFNNDDTITLFNSGKNDGEYTLKCLRQNKENPNFTDFEVEEDIATNRFDDGAYFIRGTLDETACLKVDELFEGPLLKHGFIDDEELKAAERRKVIHVSDLIRIIMDVEGVLAVKSIQLANRPLDNEDNIESKNVKWCLDLAMDKNYVPRLNHDDSKITYYKDQLPFLADRTTVQLRIDELKDKDRVQKIRYPVMDLSVPQGEFMDIEDYTSIQEDFPLTYGIGFEGIPGLNSLEEKERKKRQTEVRQLKAYLLFFDQMLANFLSQLAHVKELFSMNGEKNQLGDYLIDRTYFTQTLFDVVPDADPLYVNKGNHATALQQLTEDPVLYEKRRNKFLDHLLGRFAETFTDYALLSFKMHGKKADAELIEDKLKFLNDYPVLSKTRGKGFDYYHPCKSWHVDNVSGLEKRVSLLSGIEEKTADTLNFSPNFVFVTPATPGDPYALHIENDASVVRFVSGSLASENEALLAAEKIIINGVSKEKYLLLENGGNYSVELRCDDGLLISSTRNDLSAANAALLIEETIQLMEREFYTNPEANRKNLSCPLLNYFEVSVTPDMSPTAPDPPTYTIAYTLYSTAFSFLPENKLLSGLVTEEAKVGETEVEVRARGRARIEAVLWDVINNGMEKGHYRFDPPVPDVSLPFSVLILNKDGVEIARSPAYQPDSEEVFDTEQAIQLLIDFFTKKFFAHEGMHVIEHLLLRPRINEPLFVEIQNPVLEEGLANRGELYFPKSVSIVSTNVANNSITVSGDVTTEIADNNVLIKGGSFNNGAYEIHVKTFDGTNTVLSLKTDANVILVDLPDADGNLPGQLTYLKKVSIDSVSASTHQIIVNDADAATLSAGDTIEIKASSNGSNDYHFTVSSVNINGSATEIIVNEIEQLYQDELLPIHLDQDCESCQITDSYSFVVSVVLPYWPDRFINMDFRNFMERTLRKEAPAHVLLNICWIDCRQMHEFETKYKAWLIETARPVIDKVSLSKALSELIDILTKIRNVYPTGTLHDCKSDENLEGAIVLNNSVLGTF